MTQPEKPKPKKVAEKEGRISVTRTYLDQTIEKKKRIKVRPFVTDTATVSVKYGATLAMGDYQSARIDVMVSVPCYLEEIMDVYPQVKTLVDALVEKEVEALGGSDA